MSKKKSTPRRGNKQAPKAPTSGSRTEQIIALLRGPAGASIAELTNATGWQTHSVRGFISGTLRKKLKLPVESTSVDGERRYRLL